MKITLEQVEKLIDESAFELAKIYTDDEPKEPSFICGLLAGKILSRFEKFNHIPL